MKFLRSASHFKWLCRVSTAPATTIKVRVAQALPRFWPLHTAMMTHPSTTKKPIRMAVSRAKLKVLMHMKAVR